MVRKRLFGANAPVLATLDSSRFIPFAAGTRRRDDTISTLEGARNKRRPIQRRYARCKARRYGICAGGSRTRTTYIGGPGCVPATVQLAGAGMIAGHAGSINVPRGLGSLEASPFRAGELPCCLATPRMWPLKAGLNLAPSIKKGEELCWG